MHETKFVLFSYPIVTLLLTAYLLILLSLTVAADNGPSITIARNRVVMVRGTVTVPITLETAGRELTTAGFSINFDETCLRLHDQDLDNNQRPDGVVIHTPTTFSTVIGFDAADMQGEIDIAILDFRLPFSSLADGLLVELTFDTICTAPPGSQRVAPIEFSPMPPPRFGGAAAENIAVTPIDGAVTIRAQDAPTATPCQRTATIPCLPAAPTPFTTAVATAIADNTPPRGTDTPSNAQHLYLPQIRR